MSRLHLAIFPKFNFGDINARRKRIQTQKRKAIRDGNPIFHWLRFGMDTRLPHNDEPTIRFSKNMLLGRILCCDNRCN
jgi:hypothetical protein